MTATLKLRPIGNSTGVILPSELLANLGLESGDEVYVVETPQGFELRRYDPEFAEQMEAAREVMKANRDVLRELAK